MKNKNVLLILSGILAVLIISCFTIYNSLISKEEAVVKAWADVESVYQRRADLIPNLVKTVKGAADFEKTTLNEVIEARSLASSVNVDPANMTEAQLQVFQQAQSKVGSALNRLMVVVERYPELKATQNFSELQAQLESTENRISVERQKYNDAARSYNTSIRKFPANVIAGMFGHQAKPYFKAEEGSEKAPEVNFEM